MTKLNLEKLAEKYATKYNDITGDYLPETLESLVPLLLEFGLEVVKSIERIGVKP